MQHRRYTEIPYCKINLFDSLKLSEFAEDSMDSLLESDSALKRCDLLVFLYDSDQDSKQYIETLHGKFSPFIPKLLIYDKSKQIGGD